MKQTFLIFILLVSSFFSFSQSEVELEIHLITPDAIGEVNIDVNEFSEWFNLIQDDLTSKIEDLDGNRDLAIIITFHKDEDMSIDIVSAPATDSEILDGYESIIRQTKSPRTVYCDYSFALTIKINEGSNDDEPFVPAIQLPIDKHLEEFEQLELIEKKIAIKDWINNDVIPILALLECETDTLYPGVISIGHILRDEEYLTNSVDSLTNYNNMYWRAVMEMQIGNQLIILSRISMHVMNDEFDRADRLMFILGYFSDDNALANYYYDILYYKLESLINDISVEVNKGIVMHDKGEYAKAIEHYKRILVHFPKSAWLNYEIYFSESAKADDYDGIPEMWNKASKHIYYCNPTYPMAVTASTGKEAYFLLRRQSIGELFQSKDKFNEDVLEYANIAFDLKDYGFAAELYWQILSMLKGFENEEQDILAYYIYCMNELGCEEVIESFKGNYKKEFKKIEKQRSELMKNNPIYQSFEVKD